MAGKNKTYELMLKIGGKVDGSLKTACSTADKNLAALGKTAKTAGKIAAGAMVAAATAVATLGTAAVKSAAEYEAQLANVSTLLTGTEAEVAARTAEIGDQVLEISNRTGVATADLTDGMYQVVSAFGDSADAAAILETAAKSAAAGNATTTDSINLLSAVTKGYGDTSAEAVQQALHEFHGAGRRLEFKGRYHGADVYDDYSHHPAELHALLSAVRLMGYRRVICAFQPHTYSRTKALFSDFVRELSAADLAVLTDIYAARESNTIGISSKDLADQIPGSVYCPGLPQLTDYLASIAQPGDIILTVGAGDIYKAGEKLLKLQETPANTSL